MNGQPNHHAQTHRRWERAGLWLFLAVHWLALALEKMSPAPAARLCLALPICIKLYPAFLLIIPVIRHDWRCLAGCGSGRALGLVVVPSAMLGPQGMADAYRRFNEVLIRPALGLGSDPERDAELTGATATDSQSFSALLHTITHPDRATRPAVFVPWVRKTHWALGAIFTTVTLAAMWERVPFPCVAPWLVLLFGTNIALPGFESWKDFGVTLGATLLLWTTGIFELLRNPPPEAGATVATA